jgi:hypothetical protein
MAQTSQVQALVNYARSLVDYDRAVGRTLRKNNVEIDKQLYVKGGTDSPHLAGVE